MISPPYKSQLRYNASDVEVGNRIDDPVDPQIVAELSKEFIEFRRAHNEDGMKPEDPHHYAPSQMPELALRKQRK